ncbi:MAG TPA: DUF2239 family protein [Gemmatimonadales bacterium]|nr:DUF2239 family protein [Gemmatimonadales bacterium]
MTLSAKTPCIAFEGFRLIASGDLAEVALEAKTVVDRGERAPVLIFDSTTSDQLEVDLRGSPEEVRQRLGSSPEQRGRGRPKLGVVAREVTLLPRHWDWLNQQPGGASVALRRLVDEAKRTNAGRDRMRQAQDAAYRFMVTMAGNHPGFEEAIRCLYSGNRARFDQVVENWPADVRDHVEELAEAAFRSS